MALKAYELPELLTAVLRKAATECQSIDNAVSSSLLMLAERSAPGQPTRFFKLESLEELREYAGFKFQNREAWRLFTVKPEDLANILEFNRIYQIGLEVDVANAARIQAEEAERRAAAIREAEAAKHPLKELGLSTRVFNALCEWGHLRFVEDIFLKSNDELLALRYFGQKGYDELRSRLIEHGYADPATEGISPLKRTDELEVLRITVTMDELLGETSEDGSDDDDGRYPFDEGEM